MLSGKRILLGVSGSIAAYKAVELLRRLTDAGASVRVVMTRNATRFVAPLTFAVLSRGPVLTDEFAAWEQGGIGHIDVTDGLDLAVVAPATANVIGKTAAGIADDALSSALIACQCPIVLAPAMNDRMFRNAVLQQNIARLKTLGVRIVEPEAGPLACGTSGQGRLASLERILQEITSCAAAPELAGITVLVTAGPTREPIDAVRFISNPSSGKMGYALAEAARDRGARVVLVSGPVHLDPPAGVDVVPVTTAEEMNRAVLAHAAESEVIIMAAAVSDFRPLNPAARKLKKEEAELLVQLERTDDILKGLSVLPGKRILVGFAAETDDIVANARGKLENKKLDLIVANDLSQPGAGFGSDTNAVIMIDRQGEPQETPVMPKRRIAERIIDKIIDLRSKSGAFA